MGAQENNSDRVLVWVDLEMTGLDPETCRIVQMAMILTDTRLTELCDPFEMVVWQPESALESMTPFVRNMHAKSGLLDAVRASRNSSDECEREAMKLLTQYCGYRKGLLAGNSISQDRKFLERYMPSFAGYLHYRQVDVSTIKELAGAWYGVKFEKPDDGKHTALVDIRNSISELQYYRRHIFRN